MTNDERMILDGYGCATCLGFGSLPEIGPCPDCDPDGYAEHLAEFTAAMAGDTYPARRRDILWDTTDPWADYVAPVNPDAGEAA